MKLSGIAIGQKVNWHRVSRGGYGYIIPIAGVIRSVGIKRVKIAVLKKSYLGYGRDRIEERFVHPENLSVRVNHVDGLDQPEGVR